MSRPHNTSYLTYYDHQWIPSRLPLSTLKPDPCSGDASMYCTRVASRVLECPSQKDVLPRTVPGHYSTINPCSSPMHVLHDTPAPSTSRMHAQLYCTVPTCAHNLTWYWFRDRPNRARCVILTCSLRGVSTFRPAPASPRGVGSLCPRTN